VAPLCQRYLPNRCPSPLASMSIIWLMLAELGQVFSSGSPEVGHGALAGARSIDSSGCHPPKAGTGAIFSS
jgi:hypothetical protein